MTVTVHVSISLDGFIAGPDQSRDNPIGRGGDRLHIWHAKEDGSVDDADAAARDDLMRPRGAVVMGRNMFGPIRGPWEGDWRGWWGDEPPYHSPVFVLTHHAREPIEMAGGTRFHFVTGGFEAAMVKAREVAAGADILVSGGAWTIQQAFAAGVVEQLTVDIAPVLLGSGERLFDGVADPGLTFMSAQSSPYATHLTYRVG